MLALQLSDGSDQSIEFVSRTLSPAERKYLQMERELLQYRFNATSHSHAVDGILLASRSNSSTRITLGIPLEKLEPRAMPHKPLNNCLCI